nr:MAG TPA: Mannosyl-glycoprotein endo-beta-N-acetylglucosaminidase [Crassvirales sp.]
MRNKWLKALIVTATVVPWSVVIALLLLVKGIVSQLPWVDSVPVLVVADTIINEQPKFFSQAPKEGLEEALSYYGLEHKDIVYAQAVLETGHFKSKACLEYNNLFGLYNSKEKRYCKFKHWTESVVAYKEWIQKKYQPPDNYYAFLEEINYATDKEYISILKSIVNKE